MTMRCTHPVEFRVDVDGHAACMWCGQALDGHGVWWARLALIVLIALFWSAVVVLIVKVV